MADGHLNKCKGCVKSRVNAHRETNLESIKEYDRQRGNLPHRVAARAAYSQTEAYRVSVSASHIKAKAKEPDKYKARTALGNAVRDGILKKQPCRDCGSLDVHGHHEDYSKPLDVIWLCPVHHAALHKAKRAAQRCQASGTPRSYAA